MSTVQELKKQIEVIEAQSQRIQKWYEEVKAEKEGRVFLRIEKWNKTTKSLVLTYYKKVSLDNRDGKNEIKTDTESIFIYYEKPKSSYQWRVSMLEHRKGNRDTYHRETWQSLPALKLEWTVGEFYKLADYIKACSMNIIDGFEDLDKIEWIETQGEYTDRQCVLTTVGQLDVPHIVLSQEECFLVGNCAFLNHNCFLLTPNSLKYFDDRIKKESKWDSFAQVACASAGERWRGGKLNRYDALKQKLQKAYEAINSK